MDADLIETIIKIKFAWPRIIARYLAPVRASLASQTFTRAHGKVWLARETSYRPEPDHRDPVNNIP